MLQSNNLQSIINLALEEDQAFCDITTKNLNYGDLKAQATILAKEDGICAGINIARQVFQSMDKSVKVKVIIGDGSEFKKNTILMRITGPAQKILSGERTALNFLSHLSGIATLTRNFVQDIKPYPVKILDTRKTTPGLRMLEKYAVRMGGGYNHRSNLADEILIKDNHIKSHQSPVTSHRLKDIINKIKKMQPNKNIEIEVNSIREFKDALSALPDIIMLDNMGIKEIKEAVLLRNAQFQIHPHRSPKIEASGGINLQNIKQVASCGVDYISIGSLTHSPKAIDFSLEIK